MAKFTWNEITITAETPEGMNLEDRASFQYFNANGLVAAKRALDDRITKLVDAGIVKSGWHLAYGSLSHTWTDNMSRVAMKKRTSRSEVAVAENLLREEIAHVTIKVKEQEAKVTAKDILGMWSKL